MNAGQGGLRGAPLTKALLIATVTSSVVVQAAKSSRRRPPLLVEAFAHVFVFRNLGELLFGASLLYYFRLFERQLGPARYASFVAVSCGLAYALEAAAAVALHWPIASGPHTLVFANLASFVVDVPPLHKFSLFGMRMTDKAFIYLAALQLLMSASRRSLTAGLCGLLAGAAYRANVLGLQRVRLPRALTVLLSGVYRRVFGGAAQQQVYVTPVARPGNSGARAPHERHASSAAPPVVEPSPDALQQLVAMGFDEAAAAQALRTTSNNVEAALQYLL